MAEGCGSSDGGEGLALTPQVPTLLVVDSVAVLPPLVLGELESSAQLALQGRAERPRPPRPRSAVRHC
ncbi:MAG: hypothetical protein ACI9EF_001535 [Pseudohongiellaceae bacterium]|jgi:hypothetical protein